MTHAENVYAKLMDDFGIKDSRGKILFTLKDISIIVNQNNVVGNILEEWINQWMTESRIDHIYNKGQSSPDFWLNTKNKNEDWLEVKSFTGSPNFDISAYNSFINLIIDQPYKLQSNYLLIKYRMEGGIVIIENCWLKKIWEISCPSAKWPVKVQDKRGTIFNLRPAIWYSDKLEFPVFRCIGHFLSALEETVYRYPDTHAKGATWADRLKKSYKNHYGTDLLIPRWMDIKESYGL